MGGRGGCGDGERPQSANARATRCILVKFTLPVVWQRYAQPAHPSYPNRRLRAAFPDAQRQRILVYNGIKRGGDGVLAVIRLKRLRHGRGWLQSVWPLALPRQLVAVAVDIE